LPTAELVRVDGKWQWAGLFGREEGLAKRPGLQGPIDDVLLESFLVVAPSGKAASDAVQQWVDFELAHFQDRWRALYRGELRVKLDRDVTPEDLERHHLIVWGDPTSNRLLARLLEGKDAVHKLPLAWSSDKLEFRGAAHDAALHVPLLIYPNPLHPQKYVVLNSGPTFREAHDRTNSLQNPKLGDWAIIDLSTPPSDTAPGRVVDNGFFDERWR
jgi:hypothetical protein